MFDKLVKNFNVDYKGKRVENVATKIGIIAAGNKGKEIGKKIDKVTKKVTLKIEK